ncbi:hypothetical protein T12_10044 [Trichinella patagoniensis]|uniref:Uncharacterized protein n=1 Tax=Trichinella patagoniensis TaxID=990121 RepID=A0A0V0Z954_9BILA|nr:hypothetical protein T12_10044 [Trichinella patagoniensis]
MQVLFSVSRHSIPRFWNFDCLRATSPRTKRAPYTENFDRTSNDGVSFFSAFDIYHDSRLCIHEECHMLRLYTPTGLGYNWDLYQTTPAKRIESNLL